MDFLPPELLDLIAGHCDHADLKNLRRTNTKLRDASTPLVFEHHYIGLFEYCLHDFVSLAKSSLAKHVRKFTFYSDLLPRWTRTIWEHKIDRGYLEDLGLQFQRSTHCQTCETCRNLDNNPCEELCKLGPGLPANFRGVWRPPCDEARLDAAWLEFTELRASQRSWNEERVRLTFKAHFAMLPNVEEAFVTAALPFQGQTNKRPVWKRLHRRMLVGPDNWRYGGTAAEDLKSRLPGRASLCLLEAMGHRSAYSGTEHITKLSIDRTFLASYHDLMNSGGGGLGSYGTSFTDAARYQEMSDGFRHLTNLRLDHSHANESHHLTLGAVAQETADFLCAASQLRRLNLTFTDAETLQGAILPNAVFSLFDGSHGTIWPHLEHLALTVNFPSNGVLRFFADHSSTLRSLEFRDMVIYDVDDLLREIPKILKLDYVYAECLWYDSPKTVPGFRVGTLSRGTDHPDAYEESIKAYLLREGEQLPELRKEGAVSVPTDEDTDDTDHDEDDYDGFDDELDVELDDADEGFDE